MRAAEITSQLLDFARRRPLDPTPTDVGKLITSRRPLLEKLLERRAELTLECPETRCVIRIDVSELERVIFNLVSNARDATRLSGSVRLRVWQEDDEVCICVHDNGVGIAAEDLPHIFEPFFRRKPDGVGLGLSGVYGIVKRSGGRLEVTSEPNAGTRFTVRWPAVQPPPESLDAHPSTLPPAPGEVRAPGVILVVDDDEAVRLVARAQLEGAGYDVELAAGPSDALAQLDARDAGYYALLITDLVMPGMSGLEVAKRFEHHTPGAPVILISGYPDEVLGDTQTSFRIVEKPFTSERIVKAVRETLSRNSRRPAPCA